MPLHSKVHSCIQRCVMVFASRITGSFTEADAFQPKPVGGPDSWLRGVVAWSFTDGPQTLTNKNATARYINWDSATNLGHNGCCVASDGSHWGSWTNQIVSVPELAILPRLPRVLKSGLGLGLEAALTTRLQHATASAATVILRTIRMPARQDGVFIDLSRVRVEVAEMCSGLQTLGLMLAAAALIAAVLPARRLPWALGLFVSAIVLALEANALRVAGISIGLEQMGAMSREWKDWIQIGTTGLALGQLAGIERLIGHPEAHGRVAGHVRAQSLDE